jgi:transcriptional regulator with XRE-family HTH domain
MIYINSQREVYIIRYDDIYDRISELCEERGWSNYKLMNESGIAKSTFYNMLEKKSVPQIDMIQKICDGFNMTLGEFFADKVENNRELSKDDMSFVAKSRELNAGDRGRALAYMQALLDRQSED